MTPNSQFQQFIETFPESSREDLQTVLQTSGMLTAESCRAVTDYLNIPVEILMQRLLPMAKRYSVTPISDFKVGAVAKARMSEIANEVALFLGANIEFPAQALTQTIHAEQSAVMNAWLQGAWQIDAIAVTDPPCGYCRQFLYELQEGKNLKIILPNGADEKLARHKLPDLLPAAFGPDDLGSPSGLMDSSAQEANLNLKSPSSDPLVQLAKAAAQKSYAPYSQNFAGCAIKTVDGKMYAGRYAENAAFNPSLSALHTAIISLTMDMSSSEKSISRAVLVEKPTSISQHTICELLLQTVAPHVKLEYFEAE
jgi:cytidine deaminase